MIYRVAIQLNWTNFFFSLFCSIFYMKMSFLKWNLPSRRDHGAVCSNRGWGTSLCNQKCLHLPSVWARSYSIGYVIFYFILFFQSKFIVFISDGVWRMGYGSHPNVYQTKWIYQTHEVINRMHQSFICVYFAAFGRRVIRSE